MESIEKSIEVRRPVSTVYNQWTQFEQFPRFMDGVQEVRQLDDTHLHWRATIGGKDKQWDAEILEQVPDRRISLRSTSGAPNAGVVTFEPVDGECTRLCVQIEYDRQGLAETVGDLFGIVSRQVQNTVEAFKDFIEHLGNETGAWRGEVHGGLKTSDPWSERAAEGADSPQTIPPG